MSKRKAAEIASERLRRSCIAQYGSSSTTTTAATVREADHDRRMSPTQPTHPQPRPAAQPVAPPQRSASEPAPPHRAVAQPVVVVSEPAPPPRSAAKDAPTLREDDGAYPDEPSANSQETVSSCSSVRYNPKKASGPPKKRKRGFVNMDKVKNVVKRNGGKKIKVVYNAFIRGPSDSKGKMKNKTAQKEANPDIPEDELPPLEWSSNVEVLEFRVGRRAGKEIRGLGKAGVRELSSSTPRSRVHEMDERLRCVEERLRRAEERAEKAEAVVEKLRREIDSMKQQFEKLCREMDSMKQQLEKLLREVDPMKLQFAALTTHLGLPAQVPGLQTNCPPQVTPQQPSDEHLDGGS